MGCKPSTITYCDGTPLSTGTPQGTKICGPKNFQYMCTQKIPGVAEWDWVNLNTTCDLSMEHACKTCENNFTSCGSPGDCKPCNSPDQCVDNVCQIACLSNEISCGTSGKCARCISPSTCIDNMCMPPCQNNNTSCGTNGKCTSCSSPKKCINNVCVGDTPAQAPPTAPPTAAPPTALPMISTSSPNAQIIIGLGAFFLLLFIILIIVFLIRRRNQT